MNKLFVICITALMLIFSSVTSYGAVDGITAENYLNYEKPIKDSYGYNKGECEKEYLEGEEYFYNEYYDHWNVDKVYNKSLIPVPKKQVKKVKKTDRGIVKSYCMKRFKMTPKYVKYGSKAIKHHKGKMVVEIVKSKSLGGKWGKTKDGCRIKYNKKVKKGKVVTSYLIYNPRSNGIDDVVAVVDNKVIR